MKTKNLLIRLSPELYDQLKEMAELHESTMVDIVRRALESFLPALADAKADEMEERLRRLRTLAQKRPDYLDRSIEQAARAEARHRDPLEEGLEIVREAVDTEGEANSR